jgi:16S rRNA (guanine966-N2)-methyltransferase
MLRIIGGRLRGRRFNAPTGRHTRPTADKVREAIFNTLATLLELEGARVLDLFAGSGALGLEALSRGAAHCTFVESHARTAAGIRANLGLLGLPPATAQVVTGRVEAWLRSAGPPGSVALVLADPPYAYAEHDALLAALAAAPALAEGALIVLEAARGQALAPPARLEVLQTKGYGDTQVSFLEKRVPTPPAEPAP